MFCRVGAVVAGCHIILPVAGLARPGPVAVAKVGSDGIFIDTKGLAVAIALQVADVEFVVGAFPVIAVIVVGEELAAIGSAVVVVIHRVVTAGAHVADIGRAVAIIIGQVVVRDGDSGGAGMGKAGAIRGLQCYNVTFIHITTTVSRLAINDFNVGNGAVVIRAVINIGHADTGLPCVVQLNGYVFTKGRWGRVVHDIERADGGMGVPIAVVGGEADVLRPDVGTGEIECRAGLRCRAVVGAAAVADIGRERSVAVGIPAPRRGRGAGQVAVGVMLSTTLKEQMAVWVFPLPSAAVRVTFCAPVSAQVKLSAGLVSVAEQLSVLLPSPILAGSDPLPLASSTTSGTGAGQVAVGVMLSTTLKEQMAVWVFPLPSSAVRVTFCAPMSAQVKLSAGLVSVAEQFVGAAAVADIGRERPVTIGAKHHVGDGGRAGGRWCYVVHDSDGCGTVFLISVAVIGGDGNCFTINVLADKGRF